MASAPTAAIGGSGGSGFSYDATRIMQQQPWYKALLSSWGNPSSLSDSQKAQIIDGARKDPALAQFPAVQSGSYEINDKGWIQPKNTIARDALIAGAVFAGGVGAASLLAGAAGGATAGAGGLATGASVTPPIVAPAASSLAAKVFTSPSLYGTLANTFTNIYGANKVASTADKAAQIAADASKYGVDAQTAASQAAEKFAREQGEYAYQASETANKANYGQYLAREHRLQSVGDLLGAGPRETPAYVPQPDPNYTGAAPPTVNQALKTNGSGSASAYLKSLLDSGMDPQQASDKTNAQYPGAGALYYAPSAKTSGKAVIGLPDSYLSQETNGWNVTQRGPEGAAAPPKAVYTPYVPQSMTQLFAKYGTPAPLTPALQLPGAVGSYF